MDNQQGGRNMFGSYGSNDPSLNVPVTSSPSSVMSPYLNFDPAYVSPSGLDTDILHLKTKYTAQWDTSQYIFPEGAGQRRGRFELAFSQIGGSVFVGGAAGGLNGFYSGIKVTKTEQMIGAVRRTQMLNSIAKGGASTAQTLGIVALMYSVFGTVIGKVRDAEDELNTLTAGTLTGLLFKSSAGMKSCLRGGAVGLGLSTVYCLYTSRDRLKSVFDR